MAEGKSVSSDLEAIERPRPGSFVRVACVICGVVYWIPWAMWVGRTEDGVSDPIFCPNGHRGLVRDTALKRAVAKAADFKGRIRNLSRALEVAGGVSRNLRGQLEEADKRTEKQRNVATKLRRQLRNLRKEQR